MSFGSNVTPKRFGAGAIKDKIAEAREERKEFSPVWEESLRQIRPPVEFRKEDEPKP